MGILRTVKSKLLIASVLTLVVLPALSLVRTDSSNAAKFRSFNLSSSSKVQIDIDDLKVVMKHYGYSAIGKRGQMFSFKVSSTHSIDVLLRSNQSVTYGALSDALKESLGTSKSASILKIVSTIYTATSAKCPNPLLLKGARYSDLVAAIVNHLDFYPALMVYGDQLKYISSSRLEIVLDADIARSTAELTSSKLNSILKSVTLNGKSKPIHGITQRVLIRLINFKVLERKGFKLDLPSYLSNARVS